MRRQGSLAGLSPAQQMVLLAVDDGTHGDWPPATARILSDRFGYLRATGDGWEITERGNGAACVLRAVRANGANGKATLPRKRTHRETSHVADAVVRLIGAVGRRVADEDTDGLKELVQLEAAVKAAMATAVTGLRRTYSDYAIARELGVSRQAVEQRWPRRRPQGTEERS